MAEGLFSSKDQIAAQQLDLLNGLLAQVKLHNPFYQKKLARLKVPLPSLKAFCAEVPMTTKSEWVKDQIANPPYGTNLSYPQNHYTRCHQTSGTSGKAMRWLDTPMSWKCILDDWIEVMQAAGIHREDRFFFAFSFGPFLGFWSAFEAANKLGNFTLSGGGMSTETRLRAMIENEITVLVCTPTYAIRMGEVAKAIGMHVQSIPLRCILVAGEPGGSLPAVRSRLASLWQTAFVFDHHGMTEIGPVSFQCPSSPCTLHINDLSYFAEILDPKTNEASRGRGELILTTLRRKGSPLIRYRTGDWVDPTDPHACGCGRNLTTLRGGILGRNDDMVIIRGVNVFPSAIEEIVRRVGGVQEYQAQITEKRGLAELSLFIEVDEKITNPELLAQHLQTELHNHLALRVPVKVVAKASLPRFEMKAKRWIHK